MDGVLFGFDLAGARLAVFAHPGAHGVKRAIHEALGGEMGFIGEVVESHGSRLCSGWPIAAAQHASPRASLQCVFRMPPRENSAWRGWRLPRRRAKMAAR